MHDQAKLDKKRERNRIAASKCRQRKLEKIQTLGKLAPFPFHGHFFQSFRFIEEQVFRLKKENEDLRALSERLRESLDKTKTHLNFHITSGCSIEDVPLDVRCFDHFKIDSCK